MIYLHRRQQKYAIDEIFLVHNSGKLLNHKYYKTHSKFDDEIFSAMFTAIQEFIEDSFTKEDTSLSSEAKASNAKNVKTKPSKKPLKLNEFKVGDNQVIIEHGKYLFMAVVYSGAGALKLHRVIRRTIRQIEKKYGKYIMYWDGDMTHLRDLNQFLEKLLPRNKHEKTMEPKTAAVVVSHPPPHQDTFHQSIPIKKYENQNLSFEPPYRGKDRSN